MDQIEFKNVKQEASTIEDLIGYLKYHMRVSASILIGVSIIQLFILLSQNLDYSAKLFITSILSQLFAILIGIISLLYTFKQMSKLLQFNSTYYSEDDNIFAKVLFIACTICICSSITIALINPILYDIGLSVIIAKMEYMVSLDTYSQTISKSSSIMFTILSLIQLITISMISYVYFLFCKNTNTYYTYIYVYSIMVGIVGMVIFVQENNISSLQKVGYIPTQDDQFQLYFLSLGSLAIVMLICLLFGIDTMGVFYRELKSPIYKFIIGVTLIALSYTIVGCGGKMIRNLKEYHQTYQQHNECRNYMSLAPESELQQLGCKYKYFGYEQSPFVQCPHDQMTMMWEHNNTLGCINWNCCGLLTQLLLMNYVLYTFKVILLSVLIVMLSVMLFYIRQIEDNAISQSLRQIALAFMGCVLLCGLCMQYTSPDINVYRTTYLQPTKYIAADNVELLSNAQLNVQQHLPNKCQAHIQQGIIDQIMQLCQNIDCNVQSYQIMMSINNGLFSYQDINDIDTFVDQFHQNGRQYLYIQSNGITLQKILQNNISVCSNSADSQVEWNLNHKLNNHITNTNTNDNQAILSQYLQFTNITINTIGSGQLLLYDTLLLDCSIDSVKYHMNEQFTNNQQIVLYNYPVGGYGTIIEQQHNIQVCSTFQTSTNMLLSIPIPIKSKLTMTLQWFGDIDLDLVVQMQQCIVGGKYQHSCGTISHNYDSILGSQSNHNSVSQGEQITIDYISKQDYIISVQLTLDNNELHRLITNKSSIQSILLQSNALIQLFTQDYQLPIHTLSIKQIIINNMNNQNNQPQQYIWLALCISQGNQIIILNKLIPYTDIIDCQQ